MNPVDGTGPGKEGYHQRGLLGFLVLVSLVEGEAHGYEIMKRIEKITSGFWKPAPGSLYPIIDSLEKEGLIECYSVEYRGKQRRMCRLTDDGYRVLNELLERKIRLYLSVLTASLRAYCTTLRNLNVKDLEERISKVIEELSQLIAKVKNCFED